METTELLTTIPIDIKKLPSKGLSYPEGARLTYRPYTWGEVKKLSTMQVPNVDSYLKVILDGVFSDDMNPYELTLYDVTYIAILRHISTAGQGELQVPYVNPFTKQRETKVFQMSDIEFNDISDKLELPMTVTIAKTELEFSFFTANNMMTLARKHKIDDITAHPASILAACVKNLDFNTASKIIETCNTDDGQVLDEIAELLDHSMRPLKIECIDGDKKKTISVSLVGRQALITPFRGNKDSIRDRIHFGKK